MASTDGCHHLLDEPDLTVGSGLERTQVARLETGVAISRAVRAITIASLS
ncbi:MAG: hypothetical protein U0R78_15370 [Nocardioidaceae bacterium]